MAAKKSRQSTEEIIEMDDLPEDLQLSKPSKNNKKKPPPILVITGEITEDRHETIVTDLLAYHYMPGFNDTVTLLINSIGGDADMGWAIIDTMNFVRFPVQTTALGMVASAAADIFVNGDHRVMGANSMLMVHDTSSGVHGSYQDLVATRKYQDKDYERGLLHYINNSKYKSIEEVQKEILIGRDVYLTPDEAMAHGLCDAIVKPNSRKRKKLLKLPSKL